MTQTPEQPRDIIDRIVGLSEKNRVPRRVVPDTAWQQFSLAAGWSSLHLLPDPAAPAGYSKDAAGYVYLRGGLRGGTGGTVAAVLPAGYRPEFRVRLNAYAANHVAADIVIDPDGTITVAKGAADWVSLDSLFFRSYQ